MVAPEVVDRLTTSAADAAGRLVIEQRPYRSPEAAGYRLVVTATGIPEVDGAVAGRRRGGRGVGQQRRRSGPLHLHPPGRPPPGTGDRGRLDRRGQSGPGRLAPHRVAQAVGPDVAVLAGLLEEARSTVKASGRSTEGLDWLGIIDRIAPLVDAGHTDEARAELATFIARAD